MPNMGEQQRKTITNTSMKATAALISSLVLKEFSIMGAKSIA
jgi:hypothetical protein